MLVLQYVVELTDDGIPECNNFPLEHLPEKGVTIACSRSHDLYFRSLGWKFCWVSCLTIFYIMASAVLNAEYMNDFIEACGCLIRRSDRQTDNTQDPAVVSDLCRRFETSRQVIGRLLSFRDLTH